MKIKKILKWLGIVLIIFIGAGCVVYVIYLRPFLNKMKQTEVVQIDKNVLIITGGGGNSGIISSDSLVIVVDTKMDDAASTLHEKVMDIAGAKPVLVINTHWHPDHVDGNKLYKNAAILAGGNYTAAQWKAEAGQESMPTRWLKDTLKIPMGEDTVTVFNLIKDVHTPGDVMVYLPMHKLLFGGDVILNKQAPILLGDADGDNYLKVLSSLPRQLNIQTVVPGHGTVGGIEIITGFKQYFTDMKVAAADPGKQDELVAKYKQWNQLPFFMSPGATIRFFKKKGTQ